MKRLIYIGVIVAILAIMMIPPMTDSYVGSTEIYTIEYFQYGSYYSNLFIWGYAKAWEEPCREVKLYVYIRTSGTQRIFPAVELYSEPYPDPYEPNANVLSKYYYEEGVPPPWYPVSYTVRLREDEDYPAVFGRASFGVWADAGPYGIVYNIEFHDNGTAPDIIWDEDLSGALAVQMWQWEGDDPSGFY